MVTMINAEEVRAMKRGIRRPKHSFQVRYRPFTIQPFCIAPILPGETLKHGLLQARTVTDPIKHPLIGWWQEHWLFYIPMRALADRDKLTAMFLNAEEDMTSLDSATNLDNYHENGSSGTDIDYVKLCLERIVEDFFRYEGEQWNTAGTTITSVAGNAVPVAQLPHQSIADSAINDTDYRSASTDLELLDISAGTTLAGGDDKLKTSELEDAMQRYMLLRDANLTDLTAEQYFAQYYGADGKEVDPWQPELIRYVRDWTYPTNTIDTTNGTPRSACSWVTKATIEKDRFFREPGFIFGITTARPKVYLKGLSSNAVGLMKSQRAWLPPSLMRDANSSMVKVAAGDPPLTNNTDAYWVDINDLLQYGDQFINFALSATDANLFGAPVAGGTDVGKRYPATADIDALFVSASPANQVRSDGVLDLSIASRRHDDTSKNVIGTNLTV